MDQFKMDDSTTMFVCVLTRLVACGIDCNEGIPKQLLKALSDDLLLTVGKNKTIEVEVKEDEVEVKEHVDLYEVGNDINEDALSHCYMSRLAAGFQNQCELNHDVGFGKMGSKRSRLAETSAGKSILLTIQDTPTHQILLALRIRKILLEMIHSQQIRSLDSLYLLVKKAVQALKFASCHHPCVIGGELVNVFLKSGLNEASSLSIAGLPRYLTIRFFRTNYRANYKIKLLEVDVYDLCSDELRTKLKATRLKHGLKAGERRSDLDQDVKWSGAELTGIYDLVTVLTLHMMPNHDEIVGPNHYVSLIKPKLFFSGGGHWFQYMDDHRFLLREKHIASTMRGGGGMEPYIGLYKARAVSLWISRVDMSGVFSAVPMNKESRHLILYLLYCSC